MKLTHGRIDFVRKNIDCSEIDVCDVGIGSGQFVEEFQCSGYDINVNAIEWLKQNNRYSDVYTENFVALCLWDVLEHITDPSELLNRVNNIFISMPIYEDLAACLKSKHLKPGEHIWYFTDSGVKSFMAEYGFTVADESQIESILGRDHISSYYFKKSVEST